MSEEEYYWYLDCIETDYKSGIIDYEEYQKRKIKLNSNNIPQVTKNQ